MGDDWIEDQPRLPYVSDSEPDEEEDPLSSSSSSISAISIDFPITPQKTRSTLSKFPSSSAFSNPPRLIPDFKGLEDVHKRQYWKSTSSNESNEILGLTNSQIVWSEVDTMREILGLLQGRTSAGLFEKSSNEFQVSSCYYFLYRVFLLRIYFVRFRKLLPFYHISQLQHFVVFSLLSYLLSIHYIN